MTHPLETRDATQRTQAVDLPWPDNRLSPNSRKHWGQVAKAKQAARNVAYWGARKAKLAFPEDGPINVRLRVYPPDRRHRDEDNLAASLKAALDGIASAAGVNDKRFHMLSQVWGDPVPGGRITVEFPG